MRKFFTADAADDFVAFDEVPLDDEANSAASELPDDVVARDETSEGPLSESPVISDASGAADGASRRRLAIGAFGLGVLGVAVFIVSSLSGGSPDRRVVTVKEKVAVAPLTRTVTETVTQPKPQATSQRSPKHPRISKNKKRRGVSARSAVGTDKARVVRSTQRPPQQVVSQAPVVVQRSSSSGGPGSGGPGFSSELSP